MKKLFIFDADGVLLNLWDAMKQVYEEYTQKALSQQEWDNIIIDFLHNPQPYAEFGRFYDASPTFGNLQPVTGMQDLVNFADSQGYDLTVITSVGTTQDALSRRSENIWCHYGNKLSNICCVGRLGSKEDALREKVRGYDKVLFCDDHPKNLMISRGIVTTPIWLKNPHHQFIWDKSDCSGIEIAESVNDLRRIILEADAE